MPGKSQTNHEEQTVGNPNDISETLRAVIIDWPNICKLDKSMPLFASRFFTGAPLQSVIIAII